MTRTMKIQFLNGGLANQVFQYIFARYYALSHPGDKMYLDDTYFTLHTVHNGYELEKVFGLRPPMLSECFDEPVWNFILGERKRGKSVPQILKDNQVEIQMITEMKQFSEFNPFDGLVSNIPNNGYYPEILELPENTYYHGYWINKNWFMRFQDVFLQEFQFPPITEERNLMYAQQIKSSQSVSVHVRRGDYIALNWEIKPELYRICLARFAQEVLGKWHLFVFSDDIAWCRENEEELGFGNFPEVTYIEGNIKGKNYRDLQLMSMCKAMIVSNSAFCFLAALLNPGRRYTLNLSNREL